MSEINIRLPELRPAGLQGKAYYAALKQIQKEIREDVKADFKSYYRQHRSITTAEICFLALKYRVNLKAMFSILEDEGLLKTGTYGRVIAGGIRPIAALKRVYAERREELES